MRQTLGQLAGGAIGGLAVFLLLKCSAFQIKPVIQEQIIEQPCGSGFWCYNSFVASQITDTLLAADFSDLCPNYQSTNKKQVWTNLVSAISFAESNWKPTEIYEENFIDAKTGKAALSIGMMQLSIGDQLNYKTPYCSKLDEMGLRDPFVNLGCGIEIANVLIARNRDINSLGRYWSTARKENKRYLIMKNKFNELMEGKCK